MKIGSIPAIRLLILLVFVLLVAGYTAAAVKEHPVQFLGAGDLLCSINNQEDSIISNKGPPVSLYVDALILTQGTDPNEGCVILRAWTVDHSSQNWGLVFSIASSNIGEGATLAISGKIESDVWVEASGVQFDFDVLFPIMTLRSLLESFGKLNSQYILANSYKKLHSLAIGNSTFSLFTCKLDINGLNRIRNPKLTYHKIILTQSP
jgi:hypothetical protein